MMKTFFLKYWTLSVLGMILLVPASYFMLTLFIRLFFGSTRLYYAIAPSFMQSGSALFPLHKTAWILYGPLFAAIINAAAILRFRYLKNTMQVQVSFRCSKYWLNTAIALQSILLLAASVGYLIIQHWRY